MNKYCKSTIHVCLSPVLFFLPQMLFFSALNMQMNVILIIHGSLLRERVAPSTTFVILRWQVPVKCQSEITGLRDLDIQMDINILVRFKLNIQKTKIMASSPITSWQIDGETVETVADYFSGLQSHCGWWLKPWNKRYLLLGRKVMTNLDSILKSRDITLPTKVCQGYVFSSGHVWMWELDYKESWVPKNWCFWTVVLEKTLESPLDGKEIQPVHPKGDQSWVFIGRTDVEPETPILLATWCEELTHLKRPWCWERLRAGKGDDRGWDGWMASPTRWTWVWVNSRSWWWTGRPGVLQFMRSQRVGHNWATELNWNQWTYGKIQVRKKAK